VILCDVNVLVYAFRADTNRHAEYRAWLVRQLEGDEAFGVSDFVLSGFLRVVTHPRVFSRPSPFDEAIAFAEVVRSRPNAIAVAPGTRHWYLFRRLCERSGAKGNLIPDAWLAALAIEAGCEWITTDRDYSRFEGLRWRHPLG
jgi:toxin-antitoxin system PIN domain toxin